MGNVISSGANYCASFLVGHAKHILGLEDNLEALQSAVQLLEARRIDLENRIKIEEGKGLQRLQEVLVWLLRVEAIQSQVRDLLDIRTVEVERLSMCGYCSNDFILTYSYGKKVSGNLEKVKSFLSSKYFEIVAMEAPPPNMEEGTTQSTTGLPSDIKDDLSQSTTVLPSYIKEEPSPSTTGLLSNIKEEPYQSTTGGLPPGMEEGPSHSTTGLSPGMEEGPSQSTIGLSLDIKEGHSQSTTSVLSNMEEDPCHFTIGLPSDTEEGSSQITTDMPIDIEEGFSQSTISMPLDMEEGPSQLTLGLLLPLEKGPSQSTIVLSLPPNIEESSLQSTTGLPPDMEEENMVEATWKRLMEDKVGILGLYGISGIGKTTLLKQIEKKFLERRDEFDEIIYVKVSQDLHIGRIQKEIGKRLGLSNGEWEQKTKKEKACDINKVLLMRKRFVVLFDDIWVKVELEEIGIPLPSTQNRSKVVYTTRSRQVCRRMGSDDMEVKCLDPENAWKLFQQKVRASTIASDPRILELARKVCEKCKGLPLALNIIGEIMACKMTVHEWQLAIWVLDSNSAKFTTEVEDEIFKILKLSYDYLDDERVQQCFQYCALFPEDDSIDKDRLVEYWICEGFINEGGKNEDDVNQGYAIIGFLVDACLLINHDYINKVAMHDVIRQMAVWIASNFGEEKRIFL